MPASPTVRQRGLRHALRELRLRDGRTASEVAALLGWSETRLTRLETTSKEPKHAAIAALLDVYGVTGAERDAILTLVDEARQHGWWYAYRGVTEPYSTYIGMEAAATKLQDHEPLVVPGLLQTAAYARALWQGRGTNATEEQIEALATVRQERQAQLLTGTTDPVDLWVVLGEAALRQLVGGHDVMIEQLEHLAKMAEVGLVKLFILPFTAGAQPGSGPFVLMTFPEFLGPQAGYLETVAGPIWVEDNESLNRFRLAFETLCVKGVKGQATIEMIARIVAELRSARDGDIAAKGLA